MCNKPLLTSSASYALSHGLTPPVLGTLLHLTLIVHLRPHSGPNAISANQNVCFLNFYLQVQLIKQQNKLSQLNQTTFESSVLNTRGG